MKKLFLLILIVFALPVIGAEYNMYTPQTYRLTEKDMPSEKVLFILDFSNSMTSYIGEKKKVDMMKETIMAILPKIPPSTAIGLRVYGHKMGFTPFEACRASTLLVPVAPGNMINIRGSLAVTKPRGMTPITYALKQAVKNDFLGYTGKKHIILLTDGGENCDESPCTYVLELIKTRRDVVIDVIAFNVSDEDDIEQLQCTALVTSGRFYSANTAAELAEGFNGSLNIQKDVEARIIPNY